MITRQEEENDQQMNENRFFLKDIDLKIDELQIRLHDWYNRHGMITIDGSSAGPDCGHVSC